MKFTGSYKYLALAASVAPFMLIGMQHAEAQNVGPISNTITVTNTITAAKVNDLNFGTVIAISDTATGKVASASEDPLAGGAPTESSTGAAAQIAILDSTAAKPALINVTQAADGAALQITITTATAPIFGGHSFVIANYLTSWNGGAAAPQTSATKFSQTYSKAFGGGTNTLSIGAKLSTDAVVFADGAYTGAFNVLFSY